MLSVANKYVILSTVIKFVMLSAVMLSVNMLNVMAPKYERDSFSKRCFIELAQGGLKREEIEINSLFFSIKKKQFAKTFL
jgi:hypothetical protein